MFEAAKSPQIPNNGGPTLKHPKLVTITYPGFAHEAEIKAFGDWVVTSKWLSDVGADYGVGAGEHIHVVLKEPAPASMATADDQKRILDGIASGELPSDPNQPNDYFYMFVFSPETQTDIDPSLGCAGSGDTSTGAWHDAIDDARGRIPYSIIPTCKLQPIEAITLGMSHELIEAATDAFPLSQPGYQFPATNPFYVVGEVGDLCEFQTATVEDGFTVTRVYSNSRATGKEWPCIPASPVPYFGVATATNAPIQATAGEDLSIDLKGFGDAGSDFKIAAYPFFGDFTPDMSFDKSTINVGDYARLTVSIPKNTKGKTTRLVVAASRDGENAIWPLYVQVK
jgi:hypothetical protein